MDTKNLLFTSAIVAFALSSLGLFLGCEQSVENKQRGKKMETVHATLSVRDSGYVAGTQQWREFLSCWQEEELMRHQELLKEYPDLPFQPILGEKPVELEGGKQATDVFGAIAGLEKRINIVLPQSFKDFLIAHNPSGAAHQMALDGVSSIGMYSLDEIGRFGVLEPEFLKIVERYPIESEDADYFLYGAKQDDIVGRSSYLRDAIVVGKYGSSSYELILLYPQVKTADGEMEAALLNHSGQFRAPSFAELMRQLCVLKTTNPKLVPPYTQRILRSTCADKIMLKNVWWT